MKVICTKCGGMNVACEAMINPNDKSFRNYRMKHSFTDGVMTVATVLSSPMSMKLKRILKNSMLIIVPSIEKNRFMRCVKSYGKMKVV